MTDKCAREIIAEHLQKEVIVDDGSWSNGWPTAYKITDTILAALEAGGFAVVPVKPTPKMIEAAQYATFAEYERHPLWEEAKDVIENIDESAIWSAMLAASNPKEEGR